LQVLNLDGAQISDFTPLTQLSDLATLSLSECGITDISWITRLYGLKNLNLSGNAIVDCTLSSGVTTVKSLNLSRNKITNFALSDAYADVSELNLSENGLLQFSVTTANGDCALTDLYLRNNQITSVNIGVASQLTNIDLSRNAMTDLVLKSPSLSSLDLSENPMRDLSLDLPALRILHLDCASEFSTVTLALPSLKTLTLQEPFGCEGDFLAPLTGLESLTVNLSHKNVPAVPTLPNLTQLTVIGVKDETLAALPQFPGVVYLTVTDSSVVIPTLTAFPGLTSVSFEGCASLSDLSGLTACKSLESVSVKGGTLPAPQVSGLEKLKTLELTGCGVRDLSLVNGLPSLESLSLAGNGFEIITVLGYSRLQNLDLSNNKLASSDALTIDLSKGFLNLSGNADSLYEDLPPLPDDVTLILDVKEG